MKRGGRSTTWRNKSDEVSISDSTSEYISLFDVSSRHHSISPESNRSDDNAIESRVRVSCLTWSCSEIICESHTQLVQCLSILSISFNCVCLRVSLNENIKVSLVRLFNVIRWIWFCFSYNLSTSCWLAHTTRCAFLFVRFEILTSFSPHGCRMCCVRISLHAITDDD